MQFTLDQYREEKFGIIAVDDVPFRFTEVESLRFLNMCDSAFQGKVLSWGWRDTEIREKLFGFLLENQLGTSVRRWYQQEDDDDEDSPFMDPIADAYYHRNVIQPINWELLALEIKNL